MEPNTVLGTDASVSFGHFLENFDIVPLHILLFRNDVDVNISVADMSISKDFLSRLPQLSSQGSPLLDIKADIIG